MSSPTCTTIPPEIVFTDLLLDHQPVPVGPGSPLDVPLLKAKQIRIPPDHKALTIEFAALHYQNPARNRYSYRLEGFDEDWIEAGTRRTATYTSLAPGDYLFRVKAANADGVWNVEGASFRVVILPPWYRTWWAYMLFGITFVGGVLAVNRVQRRRLIQREQQRAEVREAEIRAAAVERELDQAHEIEQAYHQLEDAHQGLEQAHHNLEETHQDLKATQAQLIQQEKLASLGALTAGVASEIKNPLNFVNNFAGLTEELLEELGEEIEANAEKIVGHVQDDFNAILDDLKLNARKIAEHGGRADGIVRSMLEHSRGAKGERQPTDVNSLLEEYVNLSWHGMRAQRPGFEVTIERAYDPEIGKVDVMPQEMGRVFVNLLNNAFYAVHEKALQNGSYGPTVRVATRRSDGQVEIFVEDNGPGIPEAIRQKVFEPFFTTKPTGSGTGLGLSLSYDIVTQGHRGKLTVESEMGEGTSFVIELPVPSAANAS